MGKEGPRWARGLDQDHLTHKGQSPHKGQSLDSIYRQHCQRSCLATCRMLTIMGPLRAHESVSKPVPLPTLTSSRHGTRQQTTSTWWGCSPTSSWASRRAVATSSTSAGSALPPGKQTSPGDLLSWALKEQSRNAGFQPWHYALIQQVVTELRVCIRDHSHPGGKKGGVKPPRKKSFYLNPFKKWPLRTSFTCNFSLLAPKRYHTHENGSMLTGEKSQKEIE